MKRVEDNNALARWAAGKKSYLVAAAIFICGILQEMGVDIPVFVWATLSALGLSFLRAGVKRAGMK